MNKRYGMLILSVTLLVLCFVGAASAGTWYVDDDGGADFTGIQNAIDNASVGDTIIVHSGVYYENVYVNKLVTLKGINLPVVDAGREGSPITLTADGITLQGFTATNSGFFFENAPAIMVTSNNNSITGNNVSNNNRGGIELDNSSNNNITGNNVSNNYWTGICLYYSSNNNTITGNNVSNNNRDGIELSSSSNNNITGNNVSNNSYNGIELIDSSNNSIYLNNFIDNTYYNSYDSTKIWNSPFEITYTYDGTTYESYLGNYWDGYEGTDAEGDGIGDTHYSIDSDSDECDLYPLMKPFENYIISSSARTQPPTPGFEFLFAMIGVVAAMCLIKRGRRYVK